MIIKDAVLQSEFDKVKDFLAKFNLDYEKNIDKTIYIEEDDKIIGTVSLANHIIKCVAVDDSYQGENIASTLVSEAIKKLNMEGEYYYQVFTKPEYKQVFESFGFKLVECTDKVLFMEGGDGNIINAIEKIKKQIYFNLGVDVSNEEIDMATVVINGNPFTEGHLRLVEKASSEHKFVVVFILEEEGSFFCFKDRYAMAYIALKPYQNVLVLPSTKYIVSRTTFPSYFLHSQDEATQQYAEIDSKIFLNYFMKELSICKRYVGTESVDYMQVYNKVLKEYLGDKLEIVERFDEDGEIISAKKVRELVEQGKKLEASKFIPLATRSLFCALVESNDL